MKKCSTVEGGEGISRQLWSFDRSACMCED